MIDPIEIVPIPICDVCGHLGENCKCPVCPFCNCPAYDCECTFHIGELCDYDESDPHSRGPFVPVLSNHVDGNICDVYGETPLDAMSQAHRIAYLLNLYYGDEIVVEDSGGNHG